MNVASFGLVSSAAGAPLSQTRGSETERAQHESVARQRTETGNERAENASGIGETSEDQQSSERDADGRRLWERQEERGDDRRAMGPDEAPTLDESGSARQSKDPSGQSGTQLDLTG